MPRSVSPHESPVAERGGAAEVGTDSSASGGGASTSCGSDEEDGGECSRDSSKSASQSPHLVGGIASSPVPLNGIEVRPCRSIDSLSSSDNEQLHDNRLSKRQPIGDVQSPSAGAPNQAADFGGKLRFFRDGHCILELRHDLDDHGQPKQWMQSWGKTYHPCAPLTSSLPKPPWQPQELPSLESQVDKNPQWPVAVNPPSAKAKKKLSNGQFLMYFVRSRHQSSQSVKMPTFSRCILRRAARCPGRAVLDSNSFCAHGSNDCKNFKRSIGLLSSSFLKKSNNIANIADGLASKCATTEGFISNCQKDPSSTDSLLLEALLNPKRECLAQTRPKEDEQIQCNLKCTNGGSKCSHPEENMRDEVSGHLPSSCSTDRNKACSPDKDAKVHRRPLLHATLTKKRFSGSPMDRNLDDACSSTLKKVKQECDIVATKDDGQCLRPSSSQSYNVRSFLANTNATAANLKIDSNDLRPVSLASDISPVGETTHLITSPAKGLNDGEFGQPRKKKGGYGRGRTIGEAVRAFVIGDILNLGGDVRTKYVPRGVFTEVASRYKIDATTTYRWWLKYCNGMKMTTNGTSRQTDSSQKSFLPRGSAISSSYPCATPGEMDARVINPYEKVEKQRLHGIISLPSPRNEQFSPMLIARENIHTKSYHNRSSHGDNHSPRSDDSASSGASLVDPASLYASSIACIPPNGAWQNLPSASNGRLSLPSPRMPYSSGARMPYLFSYPSIPQFVNGLSENLILANGKPKSDLHISDEPLDLTLPKQRSRNVESNLNYLIGSKANTQLPDLEKSSPYAYNGCQPSKLLLKTLLSPHDESAENVRINDCVAKLERKRKPVKVKSKGMDVTSPPAQHCIKPKHYPFVSLQVGSFE